MSAFAGILLFCIYLNVPAVLVRLYGLPFWVGAAIPLMLLIPLFYRLVVRSEPIRMTGLLWSAMFLMFTHVVSAMFAIKPTESFDIIIEWITEGVIITFLLFNVFRSKEDLLVAVNAVVGAGALMGLVVLVQQIFGLTDTNIFGLAQLDSELSASDGSSQVRVAGPIGETNRFAQIMLVLAPIALALAKVSAGKVRIFYLFAGLLILSGMMLAFSRGAILALALAVPIALFFGLLRVRHVLIGVVGVTILVASSSVYLERVSSIGTVVIQSLGAQPLGVRNADGAARGRITEMLAAGLQFVDHPVVGVGPGMARHHYAEYAIAVGGNVRPGTRRSHNLYLQLLAETGLFGFSAFLLVIGLSWKELERARLRHYARDNTLWAINSALQISLVLFLLTSLFLHSAYVRYFWLLLGLALVASNVQPTSVLRHVVDRLLRGLTHHLRLVQ